MNMFARFRRKRINPVLRDLLQETHLNVNDFIYPLFAKSGSGIKEEVASMPGVFQMSIDEIVKECDELKKLGIYAIILFGIPDTKDSVGSDALCEHGIIAQTVREVKAAHPDMFVVTDLCFCEYTDHGHCGVLDPVLHTVDNDITLDNLAAQAVVHAKAGVDMIAPSGMMDGMITAIRNGLDEAGFVNLPVMSYSTKFASAYYGPFRDVAESSPSFGDRRSYQMNPANRNEAIQESIEDEKEGADILMVKPALPYLDIICRASQLFDVPIAAYSVSGEYTMVQISAEQGLIDRDAVMMETLTSIKRAGADILITYFAKDAARLLKA
jgi:porphobilinogen synthase